MSRRVYPGEDIDDAANRRHDESSQDALDDETEAREIATKRRSYGIDRDELALLDTYNEGRRAGLAGASAGLNPWRDPLSPEYQSWERGRSSGEAHRTYNRMRRVA